MRNRDGKPICGYDTTPLNPRTGRRARVWYYSHCRNRVKSEGDRCWRHRA